MTSAAVIFTTHYQNEKIWTIAHHKLIRENGVAKIIKKIVCLEEYSAPYQFEYGMVCKNEAVVINVKKEDQMTGSGTREKK